MSAIFISSAMTEQNKHVAVLFFADHSNERKETLESSPGFYHRCMLNDDNIVGMSAMVYHLLGKEWTKYVQLIAKGKVVDFSVEHEKSPSIKLVEGKLNITSDNKDIIEGAMLLYNEFYQSGKAEEKRGTR